MTLASRRGAGQVYSTTAWAWLKLAAHTPSPGASTAMGDELCRSGSGCREVDNVSRNGF